jgi:hypothetical protein
LARTPNVNVAPNNGHNYRFNAAAKHLFRHLHQARSLRVNPLVRRFFVCAYSRGRGKATDLVALARIHELVKRGADRCRDADLFEGRERRALHQHAIIMQQCLGRRTISAVADELGISYKHCYRQRAEICRRVAQYISHSDDGGIVEYTPDVDAFRIALDQATHRCALVDARNAVQQCEELARDAPSPTQSIEALRVGAATAMQFGDIRNVNGFYTAARRIYSENLDDPLFGGVVARACIDLIEAKLAYCRANMVEALASAKLAAQGLASTWYSAPERIGELYIESLWGLAAALCNSGDLDRSYQHLLEADACGKRITVYSSRLRAKIALASWKLRTALLLSSATFCPASERHRGLLSAFDLAYGSGSLLEATAAMVTLADHHALVGNDREALRAARLALALAAQQFSDRERVHVSIQLALILSLTRYWAFGFSLLPDAELLDGCDTPHRELAVHALAKRALRRHHFEDAWTLASGKFRRDDLAMLTVSQRIVAAHAAHRLGRWRDARALVEAIVPAAERLSDAPVLQDAYYIAASVTGETRFKQRARELAKLLVE